MLDEGYQNITNIDISQTVIKSMVEKYKDKGSNFKCNNIFKLFTYFKKIIRSFDGYESHGISR